jgi:hypothetical protein
VDHSPIRAIAYAKEPDFWKKSCQAKSTDTGFRGYVKKDFAPIGSLINNGATPLDPMRLSDPKIKMMDSRLPFLLAY